MDRSVWMVITNTAITAVVLGTATTLAARNPVLAGFITALPLSSFLALSLTHLQTGSPETVSRYAVSILVALPVSLLFFVPFLVYPKWKGNFWLYLVAGMVLLYAGSFVHRALLRWLNWT